MDFSESSFQRFIHLIYDAAEHPGRWRRVYDELQAALDVKSIHMLGVDRRHGTLSYSDGANMPVEGELAYIQKYRFMDPRWSAILQKDVGQWTHCQDVVTEQEVATSPFYQEFLLPYDRRYMTACKLVETSDATVVFSTLRGVAQGPLPAAAQDFLDRLLPHLQRACRIGIRNFVYSSQALVGHLLVDKLRQPVILMTPGGEVMHVNEAAQALLRSTRLVAIDEGRLRLPEQHLRQLLQGAAQLEQEAKKAAAGEGEAAQAGPVASQFRSLRFTAKAGDESLYAFYTVLSPQGAMGTFGLRPVVMLLFYHPASAPAIDSGLLYAVFGLTPAECRVATLLAEGLSLKQIAQAQGTQHDTVRKQLRSIYQKTSTNRQPELIRLLLHLPQNALQQ
jgi:DNA-binding CsgD family transcriptional regulator